MRSLEKHIEKLLRKVAFRIIGKGESHVDVTKDNLKEFVGDPIFTRFAIILSLSFFFWGGNSFLAFII